jgi:hypothetical protein
MARGKPAQVTADELEEVYLEDRAAYTKKQKKRVYDDFSEAHPDIASRWAYINALTAGRVIHVFRQAGLELPSDFPWRVATRVHDPHYAVALVQQGYSIRDALVESHLDCAPRVKVDPAQPVFVRLLTHAVDYLSSRPRLEVMKHHASLVALRDRLTRIIDGV